MAPSQTNHVRLYLLTFNCGLNAIDPHTLNLKLGGNPLTPDLIVIALQEFAPIPNCFIGGRFTHPYLDEFRQIVPGYFEVFREHVGMTALLVFASRAYVDRVKLVASCIKGVGIYDMGNKGAVAARFSIECGYDDDEQDKQMEVTFVSAHLAAMEWGVEKRNEDFMNIVRNIGFRSPGSSRVDSLYDTSGPVFFAGDLNYRASNTAPAPDDFDTKFPQPGHPVGSPRHYLELLKSDQLTIEREAGRVFQGFVEEKIQFAPTYKFNLSEADIKFLRSTGEELDTWPWARHRFPSWCDRVLYLSSDNVHPVSYDSLPFQPTSDHRPVAFQAALWNHRRNFDRSVSPYPLDPYYRMKRIGVRSYELPVGLATYLAWTNRGNAILGGLIVVTIAYCYWVFAQPYV